MTRGDVGTFVTFRPRLNTLEGNPVQLGRQDLQDLQDIFLLFFSFPDEREKDNPPIGGGYSAFMGHNGRLILIVFPFTATSLIRDESTRIQDINLSHVSSTISMCRINLSRLLVKSEIELFLFDSPTKKP